MTQKMRFDYLINKCCDMVVFEYENKIYAGNYMILASEFLKTDPEIDSFSTWLQLKGKELSFTLSQ